MLEKSAIKEFQFTRERLTSDFWTNIVVGGKQGGRELFGENPFEKSQKNRNTEGDSAALLTARVREKCRIA